MRSSSSVLFLLLASPFLAVGAVLVTDMPNCELPGSDPDGDGRGWENNMVCRVVVEEDAGPSSLKAHSVDTIPTAAPVIPVDGEKDLSVTDREIQG